MNGGRKASTFSRCRRTMIYLEECGFSQEMAMKALYPLIEFNLKNIREKEQLISLTGR